MLKTRTFRAGVAELFPLEGQNGNSDKQTPIVLIHLVFGLCTALLIDDKQQRASG